METAGYDSSRPLAEQVAQRIKDYILEEKLKSGDKLPTETALAREMGVARSTVREAIKRLESQNILTVRHGAGSFVTDQPGLADDPLGLDFIEDKERLLQAGGVDIIQPDLSHAGGLTEVKKIASMAEAYDVALAPHCPLGPIALASCLNVDATCYNAVIQEQSIGIHYNVGKSVLDYVKNQDDFKFVDGRVQLPVRPGLGVDVNKELVLEENKTPHEWKNPVWRHKDGSVAEW